MKQPKSVTLPQLVLMLGDAEVARVVECDASLPSKWRKGQRPGWRNLELLRDLAKKNGVTLSI